VLDLLAKRERIDKEGSCKCLAVNIDCMGNIEIEPRTRNSIEEKSSGRRISCRCCGFGVKRGRRASMTRPRSVRRA
jgi:hypothetical protein